MRENFGINSVFYNSKKGKEEVSIYRTRVLQAFLVCPFLFPHVTNSCVLSLPYVRLLWDS